MLKCKDMREAKVFDVLQYLVETTDVFRHSNIWELMRENLEAVIKNSQIVCCLFLSPESRTIRCAGLAVRTHLKENWMSFSVEQRPFDTKSG